MQNQKVGLSFVWNQPTTGIQYFIMQVRITIQSKAQGCDFQKALALGFGIKTETTTRNIANRALICLLLAVNSAYFLGQFYIHIFQSCSHWHTRLKKTFLILIWGVEPKVVESIYLSLLQIDRSVVQWSSNWALIEKKRAKNN